VRGTLALINVGPWNCIQQQTLKNMWLF